MAQVPVSRVTRMQARLVGVRQMGAGIGGAVKEAAQQRIVLLAYFAQALDDLVHRYARQRQRMGEPASR